MNADAVGRLMNVILQMQINLANVTETFHQQTAEVRQQLEVIFEEEKKVLDGCLNGIDERLKECSALVEDYKKHYAELSVMSEQLLRLGVVPGSVGHCAGSTSRTARTVRPSDSPLKGWQENSAFMKRSTTPRHVCRAGTRAP